jgi:hypothetical protein
MPIEDEPVDFSDTFTEIETSPIDPNSMANPSIVRGDWEEYLNTRKDVKYSNELAFQTHLLSTISSFRHVPMALYDRIMEVFFIWVIRGNLDFNRSYFYTSRNALMNNLKHVHNMEGFKSKLVPVEMQDGSTVGVVYFDIMEVAGRMLHDKRLSDQKILRRDMTSGLEKAIPVKFTVKSTQAPNGKKPELITKAKTETSSLFLSRRSTMRPTPMARRCANARHCS